MPVLDPNPTDGRKQLGRIALAFAGIAVLVAIIASVAAAMG
ncbi:SGM_5486 family transporter-associated protein [Kitasatospora sp. NPDC051170]|nr:SGM_5486 family transporter-associated protein [Streptomyces sp. NRRL WC-3742]